MPSQTPKQHRAMEAAAHGSSTIGIPKSVGQDFVAADKGVKPPKARKPKSKPSALAAALRRQPQPGGDPGLAASAGVTQPPARGVVD